MYLANQRAGTHSTLRRGEVAGSTKKLFRQKGTGNARVGTRRTNKRRGGGTAKGPKPRDYEYHCPRRRSGPPRAWPILSKFQDNEAVVVDDLSVPEIDTNAVATILKALKLKDHTLLIGTPSYDAEKKPVYDMILYKSARNIRGVEVLPVAQFNAYTVLKQKRLLLTKSASKNYAKRMKDEG